MLYLEYPQKSLIWILATIIIIIITAVASICYEKNKDKLEKNEEATVCFITFLAILILSFFIGIIGSAIVSIPYLFRYYEWQEREIVSIIDSHNSGVYEGYQYRVDYKGKNNNLINSIYFDDYVFLTYKADIKELGYNPVSENIIVPYDKEIIFLLEDKNTHKNVNIYDVEKVNGKKVEITYADEQGFIKEDVKFSMSYTENEDEVWIDTHAKEAVLLYSTIE